MGRIQLNYGALLSAWLCLLFVVPLHAKNDVLGEVELIGATKVEKTSGVWVDGQYLGYLNELKGSKKILLLPGRHEIVVRQAGYQDFAQQVVTEPGTKQVIQVTMQKDPRVQLPTVTAAVKLSVSPNRAAVFVDGAFVGHVDVMVSAQGTLAPESEVRRFYAPIDGELADLYIAEGQPVRKDDVVARLNARGAIEAASNALEAQLKLDDAEREWKQFPEKKLLMERKIAALKDQMDVEEHQHQQRVAEGTSKLAEGQKAQLQEARSTLENARRARDAAKVELDRFQRLLALPGGGGVAEAQVDAKRNAYLEADGAYRVEQSRLAELDFVEFRLNHGAQVALRDLGLAERDLDQAADIAAANPYWNPRAIDRPGLRNLLQAAWEGAPPGA